jgi:ABC-type Fe3+ transport system substrate-binding protein
MALSALLLAGSSGLWAQTGSNGEEAQIDALYKAAKAEGGKVVVYMGGDVPVQWPMIQAAFDKRFPDVKLTIVTDVSKYHNARIENQLATKRLVADVAILQTTYDFDRWKKAGVLAAFKPAGWDKIYSYAKDPDGYWVASFVPGFTPIVAKSQLKDGPAAFKATDLLKPEFKDKLIFTYPNDDDAVLFGFKLLVDKYGWDWLKGIAAQNPTLVRGTPNSTAGVASGQYLATVATAGDPGPNAFPILDNGDPFVSWAQRGAIFKAATHPQAARLFEAWLVSAQGQKDAIAIFAWPVRSDVAQPVWLKPLAEYKNTDPTAYPKFMSDREAVELFRTQLQLYLKPVSGADPADPNGVLGLLPVAPSQ